MSDPEITSASETTEIITNAGEGGVTTVSVNGYVDEGINTSGLDFGKEKVTVAKGTKIKCYESLNKAVESGQGTGLLRFKHGFEVAKSDLEKVNDVTSNFTSLEGKLELKLSLKLPRRISLLAHLINMCIHFLQIEMPIGKTI